MEDLDEYQDIKDTDETNGKNVNRHL